ncbi:hypothetical protein HY745_10985 [Candidatus Desantisbacteria bacterium]|nr:hypothetical protein [Candidatus Desantisbacteria bacterium]
MANKLVVNVSCKDKPVGGKSHRLIFILSTGYSDNQGYAVTVNDIYQVMPSIIYLAGSLSLPLQNFARFVQLHLRGMQGKDDSGFTVNMINELR